MQQLKHLRATIQLSGIVIHLRIRPVAQNTPASPHQDQASTPATAAADTSHFRAPFPDLGDASPAYASVVVGLQNSVPVQICDRNQFEPLFTLLQQFKRSARCSSMSQTRHSKPKQCSYLQTPSGVPDAGQAAQAAYQCVAAPVLRSGRTLHAATTGSTPAQGNTVVPACAGKAPNQQQPLLQQQAGLQALLAQLQQLHDAAANAAQHLPVNSVIRQQMPAKDAGDDDYPTVECNPAWSPAGLVQAAAATASSLGLQDSHSQWS